MPSRGDDNRGADNRGADDTRPIARGAVSAGRTVRHCLRGHDQPRNPTWHPDLGLVPALSSVIVGALIVAAVIVGQMWLLPGLVGWTCLLLGMGLVVSAGIQFVSGHRGTCWLRRTLRWWLGPLGSLVDPIEMG